jgi:hypothetical protein
MTLHLQEPSHVDEPQEVHDYADVLSRVATDGQPVIVRRSGSDLAAVTPLEYLNMLYDVAARQEAERVAAQTDWGKLVKASPPPQSWFGGDEPKPF